MFECVLNDFQIHRLSQRLFCFVRLVNLHLLVQLLTHYLWQHLMSDGSQEKCLWLDAITYNQPGIKVYRLSCVDACCLFL